MTADSLYDISVKSISGETQSLGAYRGKTLLIVNVASQCGFTPQYAGLEALYRKYKDQGFVVLGFPCNQFGRQEPGTDSEIQQFCATTYDVTFPLFAKIDVNGAAAHPLYALLKSAKPGLLGTEAIKWNFTKFLVNGLGDVLVRYAPSDTPDTLDQEIAKVLAAPLPKRA
ncbi:MAG TPA: glutathione peroxidase [Vicinamibacterales bacterium]|nr:glutathione peroxidase [Vicinamibacterales bacterium]